MRLRRSHKAHRIRNSGSSNRAIAIGATEGPWSSVVISMTVGDRLGVVEGTSDWEAVGATGRAIVGSTVKETVGVAGSETVGVVLGVTVGLSVVLAVVFGFGETKWTEGVGVDVEEEVGFGGAVTIVCDGVGEVACDGVGEAVGDGLGEAVGTHSTSMSALKSVPKASTISRVIVLWLVK
jgi:hypothetical protein